MASKIMEKSSFDLEHFSLCLAANLLVGGRDTLQEKFQASLSSSSTALSNNNNNNNNNKNTSGTWKKQHPWVVVVPIYWRSPLLVEVDPLGIASRINNNAATTTYKEEAPLQEDLDVVFLDATFSFLTQLSSGSNAISNNNKPKNGNSSSSSSNVEKETINDTQGDTPQHKVEIVFGAMVRRRRHDSTAVASSNEEEYFYVKGAPITTKVLRDHMDQHDTVLDETKSHVIAKHMARALKQVAAKGRLTAKAQLQPMKTSREGDHLGHGVSRVDIPLSYEDGYQPSLLHVVNYKGGASSTSSGSTSNDVHNLAAPIDPNIATTWLNAMLCDSFSTSTMSSAVASSSGGSSSTELNAEHAKQLLEKFQDFKKQASDYLIAAKQKASDDAMHTTLAETTKDTTAASPSAKTIGASAGSDTLGGDRPSPGNPSAGDSNKREKKKKARPAVRGRGGAMRMGGKNKKFKFGSAN